MRGMLRSRGRLLCLLALVVVWSGAVRAAGPDPSRRLTALPPLPADADSFALGINDRGHVVGHSSSADGGAGTLSTAVRWDPEGRPTALLPLDGDHQSRALAINNSGVVVGFSRDSSGACPLDTAVMWPSGGPAQALSPLNGDLQSVANGISDAGIVAGTSKGFPFDPEAGCDSPFTAVFWEPDGMAVALAPLDGFPEGFAMTVTGSGDVIGGSVNVTTGFNFQGTVWRSGKRTRPLKAPKDSFVNTPWNANADGMVVGDSYDFSFASSAVVWNEGVAILLRAINKHGRVAGSSIPAGMSRAVIWNRNHKPTALRPLAGDSQSAGLAINRSGQVAGTSFGNGTSTAVVWKTRS